MYRQVRRSSAQQNFKPDRQTVSVLHQRLPFSIEERRGTVKASSPVRGPMQAGGMAYARCTVNRSTSDPFPPLKQMQIHLQWSPRVDATGPIAFQNPRDEKYENSGPQKGRKAPDGEEYIAEMPEQRLNTIARKNGRSLKAHQGRNSGWSGAADVSCTTLGIPRQFEPEMLATFKE
ncbi:hypothetical protein DFH07DRAFT_767767 [Mycena maculata]|uniref:Uncharacterized protein n=1 Tax=Mycena maculata TaxID=230809 RepID=A0AAD7JVV1_9AGAR|nr:hypothetical protein DFH07DRAFT_767767 [Mycena maculata]